MNQNIIYTVYGDLKLTLKNMRPDVLLHNPVMFLTEVSLFVSIFIYIFPSFFGVPYTGTYRSFYVAVVVLLFLTVFFSSISTALSEGKSKAITDSLKKFKTDVIAHVQKDGNIVDVRSNELKKNDIIIIYKDEIVPIDGEVIEGSGYVDESNVTGESRAVMKVIGDTVTGSTRLVTDKLKIRATADPGSTFIDKMIELVEKSTREKTPNEISLTVFLSGLTLIFLVITASIFAISHYFGRTANIVMLIVLLIALIPTTIGALLPAIGIAAINKVSEYNIIAKSGRAIENAGDIDTIILDKTGTITIGERKAVKFYPNKGISDVEFAKLAAMSSYYDQTKEGLSIFELAKKQGAEISKDDLKGYEFIPFSSETKFSGIQSPSDTVIKGSLKALKEKFQVADEFIEALCKEISMRGGTAIPVVHNGKFAGVIELQDLIKPGIKERISEIKNMDIKTVMCTGDDEVTAQYISAQAGIDEYIANSKPVDKYNVVIREKEGQRMVAMVGDGTNDAPALAKADVGLAMNNGTQAAKEAANMIDLDSNPTKLMDVIFLGKQILITRGSLTTFSIANDISKYFVIIPAIFYMFPSLSLVNILDLTDPIVAVTSALIFNTIIIVFLIPLALGGVHYKPTSISEMLKRNLMIYGIGGVITPFIAIKLIYMLLIAWGVTW
ncbi:K+-transporting ATPase B chain [Thermoplasma volcanium GSS1]|uniref:Potassium-transporting ATPase ATP-binding subunit n=1 Tax=Thermoplasma volcanium (strain ATCC 51530 / DSM 4299 / JCM 9571 / NBRC 15438 / GSS1) TaxID=273116 RepID=KDPB_THEVO|nr:potassium-transporting ATPase subunit KdpB [Thermoplasma volcanium]Q97BF6.1 RecName: Full=Potassium-transporting ATPase ATP-binding subunit; AltName: Full=ATP phosphohydrolase [potassium-transporting] B chain; AltName: Full=Potassium-binding and translocating subunit B; AltName: Full=Potassium-translocating ATPase B chain [Thermoplasma volcanium GSS1]BAB59642.1 K+-transporting ATPase B chain [Thermoplasma volcanium GSS1]